MSKILRFLALCIAFIFSTCADSFAQSDLKIVMIRHAEKPKEGDNLTCKGLNRALELPRVLISKFGVPDYTYVPSLTTKDHTKHARMFETAMPLAVKYNLAINSQYDKDDAQNLAAGLLRKKGTVLLVWEHHAIAGIVRSLGIKEPTLNWSDDDFDSIWIVTFENGKPKFTKDIEGLSPTDNCTF